MAKSRSKPANDGEPLRTAVVVVHGMGSQRPNDTLREVVQAVWKSNPDVIKEKATQTWIKPSIHSDLFDLATVTTKPIQTSGGPRAFEFHEFYWAHLLSDTRPVAVLLWLFWLLRKGPHTSNLLLSKWLYGSLAVAFLVLSTTTLLVTLALHIGSAFPAIRSPEASTLAQIATAGVTLGASGALMFLCGRWYGIQAWLTALVLAFIAALVASASLSVLPAALSIFEGEVASPNGLGAWLANDLWPWFSRYLWTPLAPWAVYSSIAVLLLYILADAVFMTPYFGDVARYMRPAPANVKARESIQDLGVRLLERLHASGRFDRIIVVAHSLGSVVAYDILKAAYARAVKDLDRTDLAKSAEFRAVDRFDTEVTDKKLEAWRGQWRKAVRRLSRVAAGKTVLDKAHGTERKPWLISDFITMGSPLTHAAFLLGSGSTWAQLQNDFRKRRQDGEFPCCPPRRGENKHLLTYVDATTGKTKLQHAGLFGLVRWTNLYFRAGGLGGEDFIGGELAEKDRFGVGIRDIELTERVEGTKFSFAHAWYWSMTGKGSEKHLIALRGALDLADRDAN